MIQLHTRRLLMRGHAPQDLETHYALLSDVRAMRYLPEFFAQTREQARENPGHSIAAVGQEPRKHDFLRIENCRTLGCLKENTASERVMLSCGFIREAEFVEFRYHEGKLKDRVEYRLLRRE